MELPHSLLVYAEGWKCVKKQREKQKEYKYISGAEIFPKKHFTQNSKQRQ